MRVSPCGWAVDLSRYTYRYRVYPVADDPTVMTTIRTYFTAAPFIPVPHTFSNPTFDVDNEADYYPGVSHDWQHHRIVKAPPAGLLGHCARWAGTDAQWLGDIPSTLAPLPVGPAGLPLACACWNPMQPTLRYPWPRLRQTPRRSPRRLLPTGVRPFPGDAVFPVAGEAPLAMLRPTMFPAARYLSPMLKLVQEPGIYVVCGGDEGWFGNWTLTVSDWAGHPELEGSYTLLPLGPIGSDYLWAMAGTIPVNFPPGGTMTYMLVYRGGTGCYRITYGGSIGPVETSGAVISRTPLTLSWTDVPAVSGGDTIDFVAVATP